MLFEDDGEVYLTIWSMVMAYDLHIERVSGGEAVPIPLKEWCAAVASTEGVRLRANSASTNTNPKTGEVIRIRAREGDAEVFFEADREWFPVFRWFEGSASFAAGDTPGDSSDSAWKAATALASRLRAVIRGDEGELYDLVTGRVIDA